MLRLLFTCLLFVDCFSAYYLRGGLRFVALCLVPVVFVVCCLLAFCLIAFV